MGNCSAFDLPGREHPGKMLNSLLWCESEIHLYVTPHEDSCGPPFQCSVRIRTRKFKKWKGPESPTAYTLLNSLTAGPVRTHSTSSCLLFLAEDSPSQRSLIRGTQYAHPLPTRASREIEVYKSMSKNLIPADLANSYLGIYLRK